MVNKDGNGPGSVRVKCMGTQNRNSNLKLEPDPNFDSGENQCPKPEPADTQNPTHNPIPEFFYKLATTFRQPRTATKFQQNQGQQF